jgi:hypothetical protein
VWSEQCRQIVRPIQSTNMTRKSQRSGVDKTRPAKCLWNHLARRTVGSPPVHTHEAYLAPLSPNAGLMSAIDRG